MSYVDFSLAQNHDQRQTLEAVERYLQLYNHDVKRFVPECYTEDYTLYMAGGEMRGHQDFADLEIKIAEAVPGRHLALERLHLLGDKTAVLEMLIMDTARPEWFEPLCVFLECRGDKICEDRSYLIPQTWPALDKVAHIPAPGGLGAKFAARMRAA